MCHPFDHILHVGYFICKYFIFSGQCLQDCKKGARGAEERTNKGNV